jgi:hypothetical protein
MVSLMFSYKLILRTVVLFCAHICQHFVQILAVRKLYSKGICHNVEAILSMLLPCSFNDYLQKLFPFGSVIETSAALYRLLFIHFLGVPLLHTVIIPYRYIRFILSPEVEL